jgi:hypothetical protein
MKDPPRLLDEGADAFERSLLNAASEDIGSERLLKKTLAAAGIVSIGAAATTARRPRRPPRHRPAQVRLGPPRRPRRSCCSSGSWAARSPA